MSRVTRREWYRRVNAAWPEHVPALSADEAVRAAKRLYRFAMKRTWRGCVHVASGNRHTWVRGTTLTVNPSRGWHSLVHLLSHYCAWQRYSAGHDKQHARLELAMIKQVIKRGWLDGKLKTADRVLVTEELVRDERKLQRLARKHAQLKRWQTKKKRAETAIYKLTRSIHAAERRLRT